MEISEFDFTKPERGLTVSTKNKTHRKHILRLIHKAIKRGGIRNNRNLFAVIVGECFKDKSAYSRAWHLVFSDEICDFEKKEIEEAILKSEQVEGDKRFIIKWSIYNNNGYIFKNEKHTYFKIEKII